MEGRLDVDTLRRTQVDYRPGVSLTATFAGRLEVDDLASDVLLVAHVADDLSAGATIVEAGPAKVAVWTPRSDPGLPGLRIASDPGTLSEVLRRAGIDSEVTSLRTRSYRPLRRAVVEARSPSSKLYIKVVRPKRLESLRSAHQELAGYVRVPKPLLWSEALGVVILEPLAGPSLGQLIRDGGPLPGLSEILSQLERLPVLPDRRTLTSPVVRAPAHTRLIVAVSPVAGELASELTAMLVASEPPASDAVHGDLHANQIMMMEGSMAFVDVDTVGVGSRVSDIATLIAHIASMSSPHALEYSEQLFAHAESLYETSALRYQVSAAMIGFATIPFKAQMVEWEAETRRRLVLAKSWLAR